ncbi:dihydropteroate synthase [Cryobacterium mesophilum]|nr:dihydropteroate synthase [Terrimesophilobacter mesophilus]MBB5633315.1 dihydropteroate synthase [Terrimesophilobacter mesophilus]
MSTGRPYIMGVLNVTPDSFSDGGMFHNFDDAVDHAVHMFESGANVIDVGGESTRPGAERLPADKEKARVLPVIRELVARDIPVSIDTMNAVTAAAAIEAGAALVNDVSGGLADRGMPRLIAETGIEYVAMHWRGHSATMDNLAVYTDVVRDVRNELKHRVAELIVAGVRPERIILDPGLGFAKTAQHNWQLLGRLRELETLGHRMLIGASRKKFLGELLPDGAPTSDRDPATATISALAAESGVWGVRVHDVAGTLAALEVWEAWNAGRAPAPRALGSGR